MSNAATKIETPKQAARRLAAKPIRDGFKPVALHEYQCAKGKPVLWRIRCKHADGSKWIRPMHLNGAGYALGNPEQPTTGWPVYRLPDITAEQKGTIWIVEGENCADSLADLNFSATTSGSASSADTTDWSPLAGRNVVIWPDNDDAGHKYAADVAVRLRALECSVQIIDVAQLNLPEHGDVVDWLEQHPSATADDVLTLAIVAEQEQPDDNLVDDEAEPERRAQTDLIVEYVCDRAEVFHGDNDVAYMRDRATGEVRPIGSRSFRHWLTGGFYRESGKAVRDQALREAKMTLEGMAMDTYRPVHVRVAGQAGRYWLDIGERGSSLAVRIEAGRWAVESADIMFTRSESSQPLPVPESGDINLLWRMANIPEGSRLLVITWLIECMRPDTPYPVVELLGEHGAAKSTTAQALRRLIDPNDADLRGAPSSDNDLFVTAAANHAVCLENVSHLPAPIQDALCVIATGGGHARRKLYTDADEAVITVKKPTIINGIAASITRQDLVSRTITVELPVIRDAQAKDVLEAEYEANRPAILGGLLDIAAKALKHLPSMSLPAERRPRLLEFVLLGMAVAKAMNHDPDDFLVEYERARQDGLERTLEASPVALAIRDWAETNPGYTQEKSTGAWLSSLEDYKPRGTDSWPRSAKGLGDAMRRAAPALRQLGIACESLGNIGGRILWRLGKKHSFDPSHASHEVMENGQKVTNPHDFMTSMTLPEVNSLDGSDYKSARDGERP